MVPVVTIDGPGGVGKGTLARYIAGELGYYLLDSGAIYRILALAAIEQHLSLNDVNALVALSDSLDLKFPFSKTRTDIVLSGKSIGERLRTQTVAEAASQIAIHKQVRVALMALQRRQERLPGLVGDGRDLGTVVFPYANLKIFLDANLEVRAERRYQELIESGQTVDRSAILRDLEIRDRRDRGRRVAPLVPAYDAYIIDSSKKTAADVFADVRDLCQSMGMVRLL